MAHYHPVSYEVEGRIRQGEKLDWARRRRQVQAAREGRGRPARSLFDRMRSLFAAVVRKTAGIINGVGDEVGGLERATR